MPAPGLARIPRRSRQTGGMRSIRTEKLRGLGAPSRASHAPGANRQRSASCARLARPMLIGTRMQRTFDVRPFRVAVVSGLMVGLVLVRSNNQNVSSETANPAAVYTAQDVDRMIKEALAKQTTAQPQVANETLAEKTQSPPKSSRNSTRPVRNDFAKSRRPLSRAEREQLAADLRLLSRPEDETLDLLGDRINR